MQKAGDWGCPKCGENVFASKSACWKCGTTRDSSYGKGGKGKRPDWTCHTCNFVIYGSKDECFKCGTTRDSCNGKGVHLQPLASSKGKRPDWTCQNCNFVIYGHKDQCGKCGASRPSCDGQCDGKGGKGGKRPDWTCTKCNFVIFGSKDSCFKCGTKREDVMAIVTANEPTRTNTTCETAVPLRPGDWKCPDCGDVQFSRNKTCRQCGRPQPDWLGANMGLAPPTYWEARGASWNLKRVTDIEMDALKLAMSTSGSLGGRDQRTKLDYKGFRLACAWRIQHPGLWGKYAMERENMRSIEATALRESGIDIPSVDIRSEYKSMKAALPANLDEGINEVFLSHGSKPESILAILSGGLNERFSGGMFGNGTYFAEDIGKNDQYCTYDDKYGAHPELHQLLFDDVGYKHPGKVLYVFFCRVLLGHRIRSSDGNTDIDSNRSIWSSAKRELATIQGSKPPVIHHSLLVETGNVIKRYREFVVYHGDRIYPEYLVAYNRT